MGRTLAAFDRQQVGPRAEEDHPAADGWRGEAFRAQRVGRQQLKPWAGPQDVDLAVLTGEVQVLAARDRRGSEADAFEALAVHLVAGLGLEARHDAVVAAAV